MTVHLPTDLIVVTGSRHNRNRSLIYGVLDNLGPCLLAHGGAQGADRIAGDWAHTRGIEVAVYPAKWDLHGKAAGHRRNREMLKDARPDLVVAFPLVGPRDLCRGTWNCIETATEMGIWTLVVPCPTS